MQFYNYLIYINTTLPGHLRSFLNEMGFTNFKFIPNPFGFTFDLEANKKYAPYKLGYEEVEISALSNSGPILAIQAICLVFFFLLTMLDKLITIGFLTKIRNKFM